MVFTKSTYFTKKMPQKKETAVKWAPVGLETQKMASRHVNNIFKVKI